MIRLLQLMILFNNMAIQDALELSQCLTDESFTGTRTAIGAYEERMRKRAARAAKDTLESSDLLHSPGAISFMVGMMGQYGPQLL